MMDNRVFDVNGRGLPMLIDTLKLAFYQEGPKTTAQGWRFEPDKGLILFWYIDPAIHRFPAGLAAEQVAIAVWEWLQSKEVKTMKFEGVDEDIDHDGDNKYGWRVHYHFNYPDNLYMICIVRPSWNWLGK